MLILSQNIGIVTTGFIVTDGSTKERFGYENQGCDGFILKKINRGFFNTIKSNLNVPKV